MALPAVDPAAPPRVETLTEADWDELQVSGIPVMVAPNVSMTVGVMVFEVLVAVVTVSVIDCTGHVVKFRGTLVALPMVAKRGVRPGTLAVSWTCPWSKTAVVLSVATAGIRVCQLKTPTVLVMSTPRLNAFAW